MLRQRSRISYDTDYCGTSFLTEKPFSFEEKYSVNNHSGLYSFETKELMTDFTNPILYGPKGRPYRQGGPMSKTTFRGSCEGAHVERWDRSGHYHFSGKYFPYRSYIDSASIASLLPWLNPPSKNDLTFYGTSGIKRFSPTTPKGALAQAIVEIRDIPRIPLLHSLRDQAKNFLNKAGDEYLNAVFGWKPFLNDLKDFHKNVLRYDKAVKDLDRDNLKKIKRTGRLHSESTPFSFDPLSYQLGYPIQAGDFYSQYGTVHQDFIYSDEYWFSGNFSYYIPPPNQKGWLATVQRQEALQRIIFGVDLTPRLVWQLTPWSWLADWCFNFGDVISNAVNLAGDGLTMSETYVMNRRFCERATTLQGALWWDGSPIETNTEYSILEYKTRSSASPFGFGLNPETFSPSQEAILAALAFSRA